MLVSKKRYFILRNRIKCTNCNDIIESLHRHDFKFCKCQKVAVDGGEEYLRRLYSCPYVELSEYSLYPTISFGEKIIPLYELTDDQLEDLMERVYYRNNKYVLFEAIMRKIITLDDIQDSELRLKVEQILNTVIIGGND